MTHTLAGHLKDFGHQVRVVTNRYPRSLPAQETLDGITVQRLLFLRPNIGYLRRNRADLFLASLYFFPRTQRRLEKVMREFRPDVVNVHFPDYQTPYVLSLQRRFQFRLVVSLHGDDIERFVRWTTADSGASRDPESAKAARHLRSILQSADGVTACSRDLLNKAISFEPSVSAKGQVIPNGVDPDRFMKPASYHHTRPYVFSFGRLTYKKGFDLLLDAFAKAERNDLDLIIAGEGEQRTALEAQAKALGLDRHVHFFGRATPEEVVKLLHGSLFGAVPSRSEPFGIVALETLAAGKPLLATRTGGLVELLNEFDGFGNGNHARRQFTTGADELPQRKSPLVVLVEPNEEALAKGLAQMLELPRNGVETTAGYQLPGKYTWSAVARSYETALTGAQG